MIKINNASILYPVIDFNSHSLQIFLKNVICSPRQSYKKNKPKLALSNITLKINNGDKLGVIGLNGAGKSTFLKMISGILPPTSGSVTIDGIINSLIDPSLGMDLNQSGLANIRNRLLFQGYTIREINSCVDEIINFCDIGDAIYQPVRTYSTGMFLRLSFSIATQFFPDILVLDEIIGAGDIQFRERANKRINKFIERSNILVLSTHDLAAVEKFCNRAILLRDGEIIYDGKPNLAVEIYKGTYEGA